MAETSIRNVDQPIVQPNVAAFLKEVDMMGLGYTMTSAQRDEDHSAHREGSSHTHGFACDIGVRDTDDMSFIKFMFGQDFNPRDKVNGEYPRPDLTPEAVALFKRHNIVLIDERDSKGGAHYHIEAVDSKTANIIEESENTNFNTSARRGNKDKDMYFYGMPKGGKNTFVRNTYNSTQEYQDRVVDGKKVPIVSNSGKIDTTKSWGVIPIDIINAGPLKTEDVAEGDGKDLTQEQKDQIAEDIKPTLQGPTVSDVGPTVLSQIEVDKNNAKLKKLEEEKNKNKVLQPKELTPLADLSEEEISALTDEQREEYGLQPTTDVVGEKLTNEEIKSIQREKEEKLEQEEKEQIEKYSRESIEKDRQQKEKIETENKTVSKEEENVVEKQELEKIQPIETQEMEVLDANGNIKKITVPRIQPVTPEKKEVVEEKVEEVKEEVVEEEVVEEKPKLIKPKIRDFRNSVDYVRARMKYFKSVEDEENELEDDELSDDEIKESVDMEQNSKVIDSSKRNIFKVNGKNNIFKSIIGDIDTMARGIQSELNKFNKSLNNRD